MLHVGAIVEPCASRYRAVFDVVEYLPGAVLPAKLGEIRAIVAAGPVTGDLIAAMPGLEVIAAFGAGVDQIDLEAARGRGVKVANAPDPTVGCVADMAMALLLAVARGIVPGDALVRGGGWGLPLVPRLHHRRMGILGLGRIGRAIARRAEGFELVVSYHNRSSIPGIPYRFVDSVRGLAESCDILVVACPGGEGTRHLVDAAVLRALGPAGILVNIARGSIVDEEALIAALESGSIAGAGLDVFAAEPAVPPRLRGCRNTVLMPHRGGGTIETWAETADSTIANIVAVLAGRTPPGLLAGF